MTGAGTSGSGAGPDLASGPAPAGAVPAAGPPRLVLYGRGYCHLCEDLAVALRGLGHAFVEVDVDADPALEERLGELVPVLMLESGDRTVEVCHYFLDADRLDACLREFSVPIR